MKTVYDVQQVLLKYGTLIYTGDRIGDLELMDMELYELFSYRFIEKETYMIGKLILKKEIARLKGTE
ncbi:DUF910 family protein [Oceanobacillus piezotolerans]|uniref:DUF910 family protein n=1 Tax=Oceanobacillus piezotolerans TaxID=2448030 RepID=A0A498DT84_9BACI|nr:YqgQ family protein [Oceanobacillus piezotolerans]RLL48077.1 DUF910 family protein [Oceanobacillus piezotolerans]